MKEKQIEQKFVKRIKDRGGLALKIAAAGTDGFPDRLVLMPGGICFFTELKAPGKKPRPLQILRMNQLERLGFRVFVLDDEADIERVIADGIQGS